MEIILSWDIKTLIYQSYNEKLPPIPSTFRDARMFADIYQPYVTEVLRCSVAGNLFQVATKTALRINRLRLSGNSMTCILTFDVAEAERGSSNAASLSFSKRFMKETDIVLITNRKGPNLLELIKEGRALAALGVVRPDPRPREDDTGSSTRAAYAVILRHDPDSYLNRALQDPHEGPWYVVVLDNTAHAKRVLRALGALRANNVQPRPLLCRYFSRPPQRAEHAAGSMVAAASTVAASAASTEEASVQPAERSPAIALTVGGFHDDAAEVSMASPGAAIKDAVLVFCEQQRRLNPSQCEAIVQAAMPYIGHGGTDLDSPSVRDDANDDDSSTFAGVSPSAVFDDIASSTDDDFASTNYSDSPCISTTGNDSPSVCPTWNGGPSTSPTDYDGPGTSSTDGDSVSSAPCGGGWECGSSCDFVTETGSSLAKSCDAPAPSQPPFRAEIVLVQGPPGSGKTSTIAAMTSVLSGLAPPGQAVFVCAPTNAAAGEAAARFADMVMAASPAKEQFAAQPDIRDLRDQGVFPVAAPLLPGDCLMVADEERMNGKREQLGPILLDNRARRLVKALGGPSGWYITERQLSSLVEDIRRLLLQGSLAPLATTWSVLDGLLDRVRLHGETLMADLPSAAWAQPPYGNVGSEFGPLSGDQGGAGEGDVSAWQPPGWSSFKALLASCEALKHRVQRAQGSGGGSAQQGAACGQLEAALRAVSEALGRCGGLPALPGLRMMEWHADMKERDLLLALWGPEGWVTIINKLRQLIALLLAPTYPPAAQWLAHEAKAGESARLGSLLDADSIERLEEVLRRLIVLGTDRQAMLPRCVWTGCWPDAAGGIGSEACVRSALASLIQVAEAAVEGVKAAAGANTAQAAFLQHIKAAATAATGDDGSSDTSDSSCSNSSSTCGCSNDNDGGGNVCGVGCNYGASESCDSNGSDSSGYGATSGAQDFQGLWDQLAFVERALELRAEDALRTFCADHARVVFSTVSGLGNVLLLKSRLSASACIVDEAAQMPEADMALVLQNSAQMRLLVLVGDPQQLAATVKSKLAERMGYGRSAFVRLQRQGWKPLLLNTQYRMHPVISFYPHTKFYAGRMINGANVKGRDYEYAPRLLGLPGGRPYTIVNVSSGLEDATGYGNDAQVKVAKLVLLQVQTSWCALKHVALLGGGRANRGGDAGGRQPDMPEPAFGAALRELQRPGRILSIGIITPYSMQKEKLAEMIKCFDDPTISIDVGTVDSFQGQEKDIIVLSTVRANPKGNIGFLRDPRRLNVGLTRARYGLVVLVHEETFRNTPCWRDVLDDARSRGVVVSEEMIPAVEGEDVWEVDKSKEVRLWENQINKCKDHELLELSRQVELKIKDLKKGRFPARVPPHPEVDAAFRHLMHVQFLAGRKVALLWSVRLKMGKTGSWQQVIQLWDVQLVKEGGISNALKHIQNLFYKAITSIYLKNLERDPPGPDKVVRPRVWYDKELPFKMHPT